ncbi:MAG: NAD-dependent epimerase/dehydratase family protein [Myxococcota bacterium]|jgi:UDP-glucose 4-epimerase
MRVGVTGITSDLGRGLLPLLEADPRVERVVAFDIADAPEGFRKLEVVRVDLTRPGSDEELTVAARAAHLDALFHLAFVNSRVHGAAFAHELEVIGSMHVLAAAQAASLKRLIIPSWTALYGARRNGPASYTEDQPLLGTGVRFVTDRVEVEHQVEAFAARNPQTHVVVLRFAPIVGPTADNPVTRLLKTRFVPTVLGYDPLWQVIDERDAARALHLALTCGCTGAFNIVGEGTLPFSVLVRLSGGRALPMPGPLLRSTIRLLETTGVASVPVPLLDYLRYSWVADGARAARELRFTARIPPAAAVGSLR